MPLNHDCVTAFLNAGEKAPPPVFVGRETVLGDILKTGTEQAGYPGKTRIVQGAPGAGKTSLIHEMQKRWTRRDGNLRVVDLSSEDLISDLPAAVAATAHAATLDHEGWTGLLRRRARRIESIGVALAGAGLSVALNLDRPALTLTAAFRECGRKTWSPTIVTVDEAQALPGDRSSPVAAFLRSVHNNRGLPVVLVLAGLSDTRDKASELDLTRGSRLHELGRFDMAVTRGFMERLCAHFGMDVSRHLPQLHALAAPTEGWPRHMHHAAEALARAAKKVDGDLERIDWAAVAARSLESRQAYYKDQRSPEMRDSDVLTAAVMRDVDGTQGRGEIKNLILRHEDKTSDDVRRRIPGGMNVHSFYDHLVRRGALYADADDKVHSPIPSFRRFLAEAGGLSPGPEPSPVAANGDLPSP